MGKYVVVVQQNNVMMTS